MIQLEKGQKVVYSGPTKFNVGLGWDMKASSAAEDFDLDVAAFMLGDNGKLISENHLVFYNNTKSPTEALIHSGDNLTGAGVGDDETISVDLSKVEPTVKRILFTVTIHKATERRQNFGQVSNSYIRIYNPIDNKVEIKYDLTEDYSTGTGIKVAALYIKDGVWKVEAIGLGEKKVLSDYVTELNA